MDNARIELIRKIQTQKEVFTVLSRATRLPFVICDPETFNDQVWIFEEKEMLEETVKPLTEKKNPVAAIRVDNQSFLSFYTVLYTLGINSIVYYEKEKKTELELELSGIYFMQELRRGVEMEEKENLRELEEETAANLVKSRYLVAVNKPEEGQDPKNVQVPYIKTQNGDIYQPIFSDAEEFRKFNKEKKFTGMLVTFENLEKVIIPVAKGVAVNPQGFNLVLPKEKIGAMRQRFGL